MLKRNAGGDEVRPEGPAAGVAQSPWRDRPVMHHAGLPRMPTLGLLLVVGVLTIVLANALAAFVNAPRLR